MSILVNGKRPPAGPATVVAVRLTINGREAEVSGQDTRDTIRDKFGEPWDTGATSRKHRLPAVFVYDPSLRLEFHFETGLDGRLARLFREELGRAVLNVAFAPATTPPGAMQSTDPGRLEPNPQAATQGD